MRVGFEQAFQEFQTDMIQICLENVENRADAIYIYCYYEKGHMHCNHFYKIRGKVVKKHLLNTALMRGERPFDVSIQRQRQVNEILTEDLLGMVKVCKEYEHPMPVEVKIVCTKRNGKYGVKTEYSYEINYPEETIPSDWSEMWMRSII